jgi:hypothetical protein
MCGRLRADEWCFLFFPCDKVCFAEVSSTGDEIRWSEHHRQRKLYRFNSLEGVLACSPRFLHCRGGAWSVNVGRNCSTLGYGRCLGWGMQKKKKTSYLFAHAVYVNPKMIIRVILSGSGVCVLSSGLSRVAENREVLRETAAGLLKGRHCFLKAKCC